MDNLDGIDKTIASGGDGLDSSNNLIGEEINASVLAAGSIFAERYKIVSEGKAGGMGVVYKCLDMKLGQEATALKLIHPRLMRSEEALKRFNQEVTISRKLFHEGIVRVHDIGSYGGLEYFTMEWLEGVSLRDVIAERKKKRQPFSLEETNEIIHSLAEALQHAHRYTIHRDIKPENIMLCDGNQSHVKLMDFGIAKMLSASELATTSMQMGTPYYMAPEQKLDTGHVDKRADIYSVGVILFELLTLENTVGPELPSDLNPNLPKEIDDVFRKAVALRPENRYADLGEFATALSKIVPAKKDQLRDAHEKEAQLKREAKLAEQKKKEAAAEEEKIRKEEEKIKQQAEEAARINLEKERLETERRQFEAEKQRLKDLQKEAKVGTHKQGENDNNVSNAVAADYAETDAVKKSYKVDGNEKPNAEQKKSAPIKIIATILIIGVCLMIGYFVMQPSADKNNNVVSVQTSIEKKPAEVNAGVKKETAANADASKAIEIDLNDAIAAYNNSQYDVAIRLCKSVLRRDPSNSSAKKYLRKATEDQDNAVNNAFGGKADVNKVR